MNKERFDKLTEGYISNRLSVTELDEFLRHARLPEYEDIIAENIETLIADNTFAGLSPAHKADEIFNKIMAAANTRKPARIINWKKWAVAVSVIALLGVGLLVWNNNRTIKTDQPQLVDVPAPQSTKAMITLADGRTVSIDSLTTLEQGNVNLVKLADGRIVYSGTNQDVVYNTLSNPRGSKVIDMTLSDGSHVWLNAGSSIKYPIAFVGNQRDVTINGEAYFEIAHDKSKPFTVNANGVITEVLGTHFNVNAYSDEQDIRVTLLEGSVKVNASTTLPEKIGTSRVTLKPGEQAVVIGNNATINKSVDIDAIMAWRSDMFLLDNTSIPVLMRQIARWYDVDIQYEGAIPTKKFSGGVSRKLPLSKVMELLAANGVGCRLEGRTLFVE